jgi:hypothetical protein
MDIRFRGKKPGTFLQRSSHDDGNRSLVICVPPCLLCDIFPAITVFECKVELVVVQTRAVLREMAVTPKMAESGTINAGSMGLNSVQQRHLFTSTEILLD